MDKSTIDQKMQFVTQRLVLDLRIEEAKEILQDKVDKIRVAFGEEFTEELTRVMATLVGIEILSDPENPLMKACKEHEAAIIKQNRLIAEAQKEEKRTLSELSSLRTCLSSVRRMLKDLPEGMQKETNRIKAKLEPSSSEQLLLACEAKFKDILIRTKGVC